MRINKLKIKNYRCVRDIGEVPLTKLFALIGKNNSGKSTVVKAIQILWGKDNTKIKKEDFHKGTRDDIEISASLIDFYDEKYNEFKKEDGTIEISFKCSYSDLNPKYYLNGEEKSLTAIKKILPELLTIPAIRSPQDESTAKRGTFLDELITKILEQQIEEVSTVPLAELESKTLSEVNIKDIEIILKKKSKDKIDGLSKKITTNFQNILTDPNVKIEISPEGDVSKAINNYTTRVMDQILIEKIENGIDILACGTGLQSMFILSLLETYAELGKCSDSILLVEEPEVYLHPDFQRKMFNALRGIADLNQVIYTTHSPIMISELWAEDSVKLVILENGETIIKDIDIGDIISELGIKYEDVLNAKGTIFVEGESDANFFKRIILFLKPEIKNLDRIIKFIPTYGYKNIKSFAYVKILNSEAVDSIFFIIADSDGRDPDERKKDLLESIKKMVKEEIKLIKLKPEIITILKEHAIESYFLNEVILCSAFPDIKKNDLKYMVSLYKKKYAEKLEELKNKPGVKKEDYEAFQGKFGPKNIFTNERVRRHEKRYEEFKNAFDNDTHFLETREFIAAECDKLERTGQSFIDYIFSKIEISDSIFKEPISIIKGILKESKIV